MSDAEVTTTTIVAALDFGNNIERAPLAAQQPALWPAEVEQKPIQSPPVCLA